MRLVNRLLNSKIKTRAALRKIVARLKAAGRKIVFTNGCFDLLHYGHVQYLQTSKQKGDILVVALNSDSSLRRIKGPQRPLVPQADRMRTIAGLESVDFVVLFHEETPLKTIRAVCPDVLVKGADWKKQAIVGADVVMQQGGRVVQIPLAKGRSTTELIKKIVARYHT